MNLLIAGGAGFIGSNFTRYMSEKYKDYKLVVYDKLTYAGNLDNIADLEKENPNFTFVKGDITDLDLLNKTIKKHSISHIINFAAETHVDRSIHGGCQDFVLTNTLGVQMLLDAVRYNNVDLMVNVSTDEVYGALELDSKDKFTEDTPIWPNMPYAAAKAGGDLMCQSYSVTHQTPVIVTHCSNNYGPYQYPEKIIPFFIFKAMKGEKLPIYGDGLYVRDWIHVLDHSSALDILLHKGKVGEVYNIGVDNERNNLEITKLILKFLGKPEDFITHVKDRPGHDRRYAIDSTKILNLGWKPEYTESKFEKGLKETIDWYQENTAWVEAVRKRAQNANDHIVAAEKTNT
jgi:dTDP-glucose 4,6-dehydratase